MAAGLTRTQVVGAVLEGDLHQPARGWYRRLPPPTMLERWAQQREDHLEALRLALRQHPQHVASHSTAALLHGLAILLSPDSPVELTAVECFPSSRHRDGLRLHHATTLGAEIVEIDGMRTMDLPRTIADCLRTRSLASGVALLDDALGSDRTTVAEVRAVVNAQVRWVGRPRALAALHLTDPRRESWLESYSFVRLHEKGLALPVPQVVVLDEKGDFVGRVDGLLSMTGVFVEADGTGKYFLDADPGA